MIPTAKTPATAIAVNRNRQQQDLKTMWRVFCIMVSLSMTTSTLLRTAPAADWQDSYKFKTYKAAGGQTLPYRLLSPKKIAPGKPIRWCCSCTAPANGEPTTPNNWFMHGRFLPSLRTGKASVFCRSPQCPPESRWVEVNWNLPSHHDARKPSVPLKLALELVEKLAAELRSTRAAST